MSKILTEIPIARSANIAQAKKYDLQFTIFAVSFLARHKKTRILHAQFLRIFCTNVPLLQTAAIEILLDHGTQINARMTDRRTALMLAALLGHAEAVKLLLEKGAEVNARDNGQYTALSLAKVYKKTDIVEILEKAGAVEGKNIEEKIVRKYEIK